MSISHFYVPAPNQTDAAERAAALNVILVSTELATEPRYVNRVSSLPCVVCDHGDEIAILPEPTTIEEVRTVHDQLLQEHIPTDVAHIATLDDAIVAHSEAVNPHGITPATIGAATTADIDTRITQIVDAAPGALDTLNELAAALGDDPNFAGTVTTQLAGKADTGHGHANYAPTSHSHIDADLPAGLARDTEVTAAVSTHASTPHGTPHSHPYSSDTHNHDAAYAPTHSHPYAGTSHAHADADLPAGLARDAEVAAAYSTLAHTHSYEASGAVATHAAASDPHPTYLTQAEGDGRYRQSTTALVDADIPAAIARDAEVTSAISTHAGATDPHTGYATDTDLSNHAAAADPHPGYLTPTEHSAIDHTGITGVGGGGGGATGGVIRKTAAQTMTATAQTAIIDASFAVAASSKYYFIMYVAVTTSTGTSPTTAYGVTGPAGATVAVTLEQDTSTSVEASGVITAFGNFAAGAQVANTGAEIRGVVETGGTAGTVQLTAARAGTTPSMVVPIGGVVGFWMKLA